MKDTDTLNGGRKMMAEFTGGKPAEEVFVRQLRVKELPRYAELQDDEGSMIEFVCDQPKGFADKLSPASHEALIIAVEEVNADFFQRWAARQAQREERLLPGIGQRKLDAIAGRLAAVTAAPAPKPSPATSPRPR